MPLAHAATPLGTAPAVSRFAAPTSSYPLIYLAPDPSSALLEVQALVQSFHAPSPILVAPHRYAVFPIVVGRNIAVVDFGDHANRRRLATSIQELTGDWRGYAARTAPGTTGTVRSRTGIAPTQALGAELAARNVAGFLAPSAHDPVRSNLVLFPHAVAFDPARTSIAAPPTDPSP